MRRKRIGDQHLLGEAENENREPKGDVRPIEPEARIIAELPPEAVPAHDGSRDQMREEGDKKRVAAEMKRDFATVDIDQKGDLHERRERQRERHDGRRGFVGVNDREKEISVFPVA